MLDLDKLERLLPRHLNQLCVCCGYLPQLVAQVRALREALMELSDAGKDFRGREVVGHGHLEHLRGAPCKYCELLICPSGKLRKTLVRR